MADHFDHRSDAIPLTESSAEAVHLTIPCAPTEFAEFITGLLGHPQSISRDFFILFKIKMHDLEGLHELIMQRIIQQNDAHLVQFVANVFFNDGSSVRITSFDDLRRYYEVRPLRSLSVSLNWVFMIKFRDRKYHEKQEISIKFAEVDFYRIRRSANERGHYYDPEYHTPGCVEVLINYTERTWANDVDNLIRGHLSSIELIENQILHFIYRFRFLISVFVAIVMSILLMIPVGSYYSKETSARRDQMEQFFNADRPRDDIMFDAIQILTERRFRSAFGNPGTSLAPLSILLMIPIGIIFGGVTHRVARMLVRRSQVILTRQSEINAENSRTLWRRKILGFFGLQIITVIMGIVVFFITRSL